MKEMPDDELLDIMWRVAVTTAISKGGKSYELFARQLYHYLAGTYDHLKINYPEYSDD